MIDTITDLGILGRAIGQMWVPMRHSYRFQKITLLLACILGLTAGATLAQSGEEGEAEPGGAEAEVRRLADLTDAEMLAEGEAIQGRATSLSGRVMRMLDESRQDRDIIRVTCLNTRLTETHATSASIDSRVEDLQESIESGDTSRRNHEYTVLTVLGQNLNQHAQQANECVGQDVFETGQTRVETEQADNTPDEDISDIPDEQQLPVPYLAPPASGTM